MVLRQHGAARRVGRMSDGRRKIMVVGDRASAAAATHFHDRGDYVLAVDVREHTTRGPTICSATCVMRRASAPCSARSVVAVASTAALGWDQRLETLAGLLELPDAEAVEQWQADKDPSYPVYSTSKQAVILYRKRLAGPVWTKYGVRVNTVSPVPVETPILSDFEQTMGKDVLDMCRATVGRQALTTSCRSFRSSGRPRPAGSPHRTSRPTPASSIR
jgi:NAD(P)-dependent dehydrogenase (short-subunit alcohol dehydrogenase family)